MTPLEDAKYMQRCRVAAKYFFRFCGSLKISKTEYPYYDLFVEDPQNGLCFGVKVISHGFLESEEFLNNYLLSLFNIDNSNYTPRVPIALLYVDEDSESGKCGIILSLDWNGVKIHNPPVMMDLNNQDNFERMMNEINISDYVVRSLRDDRLGILKTISFKLPINRVAFHSKDRDAWAKVVYKRSFTHNYKMNSPEVISEEDQLKRLFHGIPEDEYPKDTLDAIILDGISSKFENVEIKSSLFLFNSELRDLKTEFRDKITKQLTIQVEPILDAQTMMLLGSVIRCPRLNLSLYIDNPFFKDSFLDELIMKTIDVNEWQSTYEQTTRLLPTLTDLSKIIN